MMPRDTIRLPGGYVDDGGAVHREVVLRSLTGETEEGIAELPSGPAALVITNVLACTLERIGTIGSVTSELVRQLVVADRQFLVRKLHTRMCGGQLWVTLRCPHCSEQMQVKLSSGDLPFEEQPQSDRYITARLSDGREVAFRLPNGGDQEHVAALELAEEEARQCIMRRCLRDSEAPLDSAMFAEVEDAMERAAPSTDVDMEAACPACSATFTLALDLTPRLLQELMSDGSQLEREIHLLAWHYHWSERDILALPRGKRRRYVELIEEQLGQD